jgi:predicted outer membrane repeat protein
MKKKWCSVLILIVIGWPQQTKATNITVSDMPALQTALAGTVDTIYITADTYTITTAFTVNRAVTIIGLPSGGNEVIITMTGTDRHFTKTTVARLELNTLVLAGPGADYTSGSFVLNGNTTYGGGVSSTVTGNMVIKNCKIGGCSFTGNGGAVSSSNASGTVELDSCNITTNAALNHGGGIYTAGSLLLNNDTVSNNKAGYNIATAVYAGSFNGGAIYANNTLTLKGIIIIQHDTASNFGGGMYKGSGVITTAELISLIITQNSAIASGGGLYNTSASSITNTVISYNSARTGGGIYNNAAFAISNSVVGNNTAENTGGGIHTTTALTLTAVRVDSNTVNTSNGGGIFSGLSNITITISNSIVNSNTAWNCGGGIYSSGPLVLTNDTISGNKACYNAVADTFRVPGATSSVGSGGGVFANHNLTLAGYIVMERDTAVVKGGGIYKGATGSLTADPDFPSDPGDGPDTLFATAALDTLVMNYCVTTGESIKKNGDPNESHGGAIFAGTNALIKKGRFFRNSSGDSGGCIYTTGANANITLEDVVAIENKSGFNPFTRRYYADCSGAVACTSEKIILSGNLLFQKDSAANVAGALCAYGSSSSITAVNLNSLYITQCASLYVTDTFGLFIAQFRGQGGAICANQDIILSAVDTIRILDNTSYTHGGAIYSVNKGIAVSRANISGNTARYHGGALYAPNGSVFIDSCRLSRNRAGFDPFLQIDSGAYNGGAVYASKDLRMRGGIVLDSNSANNNGGAIAKVVGGKFNISEVTILRLRGNKTIAGPGGKGNGGAIYIEDSLILDSSINLEITNNHAAANGGAIYSKDKYLRLNGITLGNNSADSSGGAIWSGGVLELIKVGLDSNSAGLNGGAVYNPAGKLSISGSTFFKNAATNGGAVYSNVGSSADTNRIYNTTFSQNSAISNGGAFYGSGTSAPVRITFTTFNGNTAGDGNSHAIFLTAAANKQLRGNIIYGNGSGGTEINQTAFSNASYNIVRDATLAGGAGNTNIAAGNAANIFENIVTGDIADIANNGGLTQTIAIKKNGYAHNHVPLDSTTAWQARIITTDQRDSLRPAGCKADAGAYELQVADDAANYTLVNDSICGGSFVNADTLITSSQFIVDTIYFSNSAYTDTLTMPVQVNTIKNIYVKFITTSNCELMDTLTVAPFPVVDSITGDNTVAVNYTLPLQTNTAGGIWASSDPAIATVDQLGVVTGVSVGQVEITYMLTQDTCTSFTAKIITVIRFPLPLTLISFSGYRQNGNDHLRWTTVQEFNISHFEIEFSADGRTFVKTGEVTAAGNNTIQQHHAFTNNNVNGTAYYRLKLVDINGKFTYSIIIRIHFNDQTIFSATITPNPASSVMNLVIEGVKEREILSLEIMNTTGMLVYKEQVTASGTSMVKMIPRPAVSAGLYFYRITRLSNREIFSERLVLQ